MRALRVFFEDPNVRFPQKPRLVEDLGIYQMPDGLGFHFRGGPGPTVIRGRDAESIFNFLLQALDGTQTLDDLLEQCPPDISRTTLLKALHLLHTKGLLCESQTELGRYERADLADETLRRQLLFWSRKLGVTGSVTGSGEVQAKLESADILLIGTGLFGAMTADILSRSGCSKLRIIAWDDCGFLTDLFSNVPGDHSPPIVRLPNADVEEAAAAVREFIGAADLVITATRNAPAQLFRSLNRICLDHGCGLLCANEDGIDLVVGPHIQPYSSACYTCMEMRRASARDFMLEEHLYQEHLASKRPSGQSLPLGEALPFAALAASLVAAEVVRIVTGIAPPTLLNGQLTAPLLSGEFHFNRILRVPRCLDCRKGTRTSAA